MAVSAPEERTVTDFLTVEYRGSEWDVSMVPEVLVGQKLAICRNPWREDGAQAISVGADGHALYFVLERIERNEFGFAVNAVRIGEEYKRHADTPAQKNRKEVELLATGTATLLTQSLYVRQKRCHLEAALTPTSELKIRHCLDILPRQGEILEVVNPVQIEVPKLSAITAMLRIAAAIQTQSDG
jgi:hypothetical protein